MAQSTESLDVFKDAAESFQTLGDSLDLAIHKKSSYYYDNEAFEIDDDGLEIAALFRELPFHDDYPDDVFDHEAVSEVPEQMDGNIESTDCTLDLTNSEDDSSIQRTDGYLSTSIIASVIAACAAVGVIVLFALLFNAVYNKIRK